MQISQAITSDLYLEEILKLIVMVTAKVTGVEICSLWLIDDSGKSKKIRLKATQAIDQDYVKDRTLEMNEGVVGYVATHNRPLLVKDVLVEPRFKEKEMAKKLNLVSMVGVPLQVKDSEVIGVLNCFTAVPHDFSETEVNMISTVTNQGKVRFMFYHGGLNASVFLDFLERLVRDANGRKIYVIIDNLRVHHAKMVREWVSRRSDLIALFYLPSYSPDLNPDEYLNNDLKNGIAKRSDGRMKGRLRKNAIAQMRRIQKQPSRVRNYFDAEPIRYAR